MSTSFLPTGLTQIKRKKLFKTTTERIFKIRPIKQKWQLLAEEKFLAERAEPPEGYINLMSATHVSTLNPIFRQMLHLRNSRSSVMSEARKRFLRQEVCITEYESRTPAAKIVNLTEKILSMRAHMLRHPKEKSHYKYLSMALGARHRAMKSLYKTDYSLYKHVCEKAKLVLVKFSIPDSPDPSHSISQIGIDGERARFLIRQRCWKRKIFIYIFCEGQNTPHKIILNGKQVQPIRHSMDEPPLTFNKPQKIENQLSGSWPYGVRDSYMRGDYTIRNPTAPGPGYIPVALAF